MRAAILAVLTAIMVLIGTTTHAASVPTTDTPKAAPVMVPYLNKSIREVKNDIKRDREETGRSESWADGCPEKAPGDTEETFSVCDGAPDAEKEDPGAGQLSYLGEWTVTAYCGCPECCGEYATGYTASGTLATAGRTVACNSLPFGTQVMIGGIVYTVEDTGWTPYGDEWIDIYFDSHDEALAWGVQTKEVYLVG